jgi:DNA-binding response OmpR family regulator
MVSAGSPMRKRILVVDDDPDILSILRDRLHCYGYTVETAGDGCEALAALKLSTYDAMLLDVDIPKLNGLDVLRQSRETNHQMPVAIMTGLNEKERIVRAAREICQAFLFKPFHRDELKQTRERWFRPLTT